MQKININFKHKTKENFSKKGSAEIIFIFIITNTHYVSVLNWKQAKTQMSVVVAGINLKCAKYLMY